MRTRITFLLLLTLMAVRAGAQDRCFSRETPRQCLRRIVAARAIVNAHTDLDTFVTPPTGAVKDFSHPFSAHVDVATPSEAGKSLTVEINPFALGGGRSVLNLQVVLTDPVLSAAVTEALKEAPSAITDLQKSLGRGDDTTARITYNLISPRFGRDVEEHRRLLGAIMLGLLGEAAPTNAVVTLEKLDTPFDQIVPDPAARIAATTEFANAAALAQLPAAAAPLGKDFARLLSNQSQLYVWAGVHHRAPVVGQNETSAGVTWEIGRQNLGDFLRGEGRDCEANGSCLAAFSDFTGRVAQNPADNRLAVSVAYTHTHQVDPKVPDIVDESASSLRYGLTFGRGTGAILANGSGRVDVTIAFEKKSQSKEEKKLAVTAAPFQQILPAPHTPFLAAATFTQSLRDHVSIPVTVAYTERTEWLPGTAQPALPISPAPGNGHTVPFRTSKHQLSIHVGLLYRFPSFTPRREEPKCCCCR